MKICIIEWMKTSRQKTATGILFTDFYQLTMAQLYFRAGLHDKPVQFDHFFRDYPDYKGHQAGYCVNAGLGTLLEWMQATRVRREDIEFLRAQVSVSGKPLFWKDFLGWLKKNGDFSALSLSAIPEGRVVHPHVPLTVVQGPLAMAQVLESALLNKINYQVAVATKASRVKLSGLGRPILEFGMRRAHGAGANDGVRAAMIGGADFSSNTGVSCLLGYPPKGTQAHSLIQLFLSLGRGELEAFRAYAELYPDDCLLLVDTVDTIESGIPNAIKVFTELRKKGHRPLGIRLDSGDLAHLTVRAARMLDRAGFPDTTIVLSNQLDEIVIWQIVTQVAAEAPAYGLDPDKVIGRLVFGVGTRLITSEGASSLGGVYKLAAVYHDGEWRPAIKLSDSLDKTPNPGKKTAWRLYDGRNKAMADLLGLDGEEPSRSSRLILRHPSDADAYRVIRREEVSRIEPLLKEFVREGRVVSPPASIEEMRAARQADLARLDDGVKRLVNPHIYHVSLTSRLWNLKQELIARTRPPLPNDKPKEV